jgi:hypothetical protein
MAKKKKSIPDNNALSAEQAGREFGISLKELETLMQTRGHEGVKEVNETYGGLSGLGQKLKTNLITGKNLKKKKTRRFFLFIYFIKVYLVMKMIYLHVQLHLVVMKFHQNHRKHFLPLCLKLFKMLHLLYLLSVLSYHLVYHFIIQVKIHLKLN